MYKYYVILDALFNILNFNTKSQTHYTFDCIELRAQNTTKDDAPESYTDFL